jgi:PAS domain S-box-containing protein
VPTDDQRWQASIVDSLGAALVAVDVLGRTVVWNRRAEALFGWTADEVLGQVPPIVPGPLVREWQIQLERVLHTGQASAATEAQRITRDGRVLSVVRTTAPICGSDGAIVGAVDTLMDASQLKQLDIESRALGQVRERELIAMDLHDGLIQGLYGVMLALDSRRLRLGPADESAATALKEAQTYIQQMVDEARTYVGDLRSRQYTPRDLGSGLRLLADSLRLNGDVSVRLSFDPSVEQVLEPDVRGHLLYLVREAVSNVLRHARATAVCIEVGHTEEQIVLRVIDDGVGFAADAAPPIGHHGLRNMAERARLMGGRLYLTSAAGRGTRLELSVPIYKS